MCATEAKECGSGWKRVCVYYTGHGEEHTGNWSFPDGVVTLQNIVDVFDEDDRVSLWIYADCCYSGKWCDDLREGKIHAKCEVHYNIYSACKADALATETVFSNLFKNDYPRNGWFQIFDYYAGKNIWPTNIPQKGTQILCTYTGFG